MTKLLSFLVTLPLIVASAAEAVLDLTPTNFDNVLSQSQPKLIEFYASWCGHCKNLAPIYEELAQGFQHAKDKVVIAKVDADQHKELGKRYGIQGFPTLKWFDGKKVEDYGGDRDLDALSNFITEKTGLKMRSSKPPSKVEMLTDRTFNDTVGGSKNVFCAFTAPWCGHCKSLAPVWEQLALDFASESNVVIAKVDADSAGSKRTAQEQGISGYPTIKWFPAGKRDPVPYEGARAESAFVEFVNKEAGTFRAPGGGLTAAAGTIASLDAMIQSFADASAAKYDELITAAKSEKSKYAVYYGKVAEKIQKNAGYVEKEFTRLQGILKKGSLAPEKLDDITSRSNILQKFKLIKSKNDHDEKSEL